MELVRCPNCLSVYGDVHRRCPLCGADPAGEGAEVAFDGGTRAALARLGGLFGGVLERDGATILWCERGVCRVDEEAGLRWVARVPGRAEGVELGKGRVRVTTDRGVFAFSMDGGEALEAPGSAR